MLKGKELKEVRKTLNEQKRKLIKRENYKKEPNRNSATEKYE